MDVDDIPPGTDFVKTLKRNLQDCKVMLVVIGRQWLSIRDSNGERRLHNPDDFVALEIATALKKDVSVIPVLVQGADMPTEKDLPETLKPLARRQALELDNKYYQHGIADLVKALELHLGPAKNNQNTLIPKPADTKKRAFVPILVGLAVILLSAAFYIWQQTTENTGTSNRQTTPTNALAGFNCQQAGTDVENAICNDNKTRTTDLELNQVFNKVSKQLPPSAREVLDKRQKAWLKQRDSYIRQYCFTQNSQSLITQCITNYYRQRITALARIPANQISLVQLTDPPSNIRATPNGEILCQLQKRQSFTVYSGEPIEHNGAKWYWTNVCGANTWGVVHESQISTPR